MKRVLTVLLFALLASACEHPVSQAEFDGLVQQHQALQARHNQLIVNLDNWATGMVDWGKKTGDILCEDIWPKVTPNSAWSAQYNTYCTDSDPPNNHPPDPPDDWG